MIYKKINLVLILCFSIVISAKDIKNSLIESYPSDSNSDLVNIVIKDNIDIENSLKNIRSYFTGFLFIKNLFHIAPN